MGLRFTKLFSVALAAVLIGAGCSPATDTSSTDTDTTTPVEVSTDEQEETKTETKKEDMASEKEMEKKEEVIKEEAPKEVANASGQFIAWDASKLTDDTNILFFHAKWCSSCKALDANINENLKDIPAGVTIFKTDYDDEKELKKKYGVTYQHTLVQVDKDGNMIKKWSGGNRLSDIVKKLQ